MTKDRICWVKKGEIPVWFAIRTLYKMYLILWVSYWKVNMGLDENGFLGTFGTGVFHKCVRGLCSGPPGTPEESMGWYRNLRCRTLDFSSDLHLSSALERASWAQIHTSLFCVLCITVQDGLAHGGFQDRRSHGQAVMHEPAVRFLWEQAPLGVPPWRDTAALLRSAPFLPPGHCHDGKEAIQLYVC